MAEVTTRKRGNKWEYRFEAAKIEGKRNQITKSGFKTKKEALEAGVKALAEYNNTGVSFTPSEISYSDYLDFWMEKDCQNNLIPTTVTNYEKKIRLHIKPYLGKYKLKSISTMLLQNFIFDMFNKGYSFNTLDTLKHIINKSLIYAIKTAKFIQVNPMDDVEMPSKRAIPNSPTKSHPNIYISQEWIVKIFKRFPEGSPTHIPMQLGYKCGLRLGEAYALTWEDIDFENKTILISKQVQWDESKHKWYFSNPKYNSFRTIGIDDKLCNLLLKEKDKQQRAEVFYKELYKHQYRDENNFLNDTGTGNRINLVTIRDDGSYINPRTMQNTSRVIHYNLGFKEFTFHSFRHTHATMLAEADAPIKYTQERLGHKDISVTMQVYQHASDKLNEKGNNILNGMFK